MEKEMCDYIGLEAYERGGERSDYRNGSWTRHLLCEIGDLTLQVPRTRNKGFYPSVLDAYKRRHRSIDGVILACFVLGLSTRKAALEYVYPKIQRQRCWAHKPVLMKMGNKEHTG